MLRYYPVIADVPKIHTEEFNNIRVLSGRRIQDK